MVHQTHTTFHKGSHKPLTTAHLAHTMALLRLNSEELKQKIESELASNPALEFIEERRCPTCGRKLSQNLSCSQCSSANGSHAGDPIVFVSPPEQMSYGSVGGRDDFFSDNEFSAQTEDLPTYILRQIATELQERQRPIATHILTSLDDDGFLLIPHSEISIYHHVELSQVQEVITLIQHADPIGVGSSGVIEAMSIQLSTLGSSVPFPEATRRIVAEGMKLLSKRKYTELGKIIGIPTSQVKLIAEFIGSNLNPYPGRSHWGNTRHHTSAGPPTYKRPDVIIRKQDDSDDSRLIVEILWPIRGILRVNPLFKKAVKNAPKEKSIQWKQDIEQANLLVKCLGQRYHTMVRLMERLANVQRDFILHGDLKILPITRAKLADELGVHEATISRAVSGKNVQLPSRKIIPIARFFDRSLHIRTELKLIIAEEPAPLSDAKIAAQLAKRGYNLARRTVAKYRSMEGILPAHLRHRIEN